ncbi:MAG: peptidylprolyl isomerase [Bacteroidetes bacterium]|nr:MAG: peptidylprolyl isomerase [Bacteroidota bacterium]
MKGFRFWIFLLLSSLMGISCSDNLTFDEQAALDQQLIEQYAADNNLSGYFTANGVYIVMQDEGVGDETPGFGSAIEIIYTGTLLDGTEFDSSNGFPTVLNVSRLIRGWQEGLAEFKRESAGIMLIPSAMGYGPRGQGEIPPNAVLRFDIELLNFN